MPAPVSPDVSDADAATELDELPPMLREPSRLPGQARERFSPEQFFALSRVHRLDVDADDDGLWLTEAPCPVINPEGILVGDELFWDPGLQPFVDVGDAVRGRTFVIRYNRALLARGVLDEVIILEQDAHGGYQERCRCRPRHQASQVDLNQVLAERERFKKVLLAKIANAQAVRITLEKGEAALEALRDQQARQARIQRRTKRAPIAAAPIDGKTAHETRQAQQSARVFDMQQRLERATAPGAPPKGDPAPATAGQLAADSASSAAPTTPTRRGRPKKAKGDTATPAAITRDTAETPTGHERSGPPSVASGADVLKPEDAPSATPTPGLIDYFGAATGFLPVDDD